MLVASDHAGFLLKQELTKLYDLTDFGTHSPESCNYPEYALKVVNYLKDHDDLAILICGSGVGMAMVANRFSYIRAALCLTPDMAKLAREHNNANVLCLGARTTTTGNAKLIIDQFLSSKFLGDRHKLRLDLFKNLGS